MAVVEAHDLTKRFGNVTAADAISFEMKQGEVLGFLGPNGAGKTTTIRMLSGMISVTSGNAVIAGWHTGADVGELHQRIGLLTESPGFYSSMTAKRNLEYFAGFYSGFDVTAQVEKYLKALGLWERKDHKVGTFSKGMKQRLAIARCLVHEPTLLFFDEPTSGLDPEGARDVREMVKRLRGEGRSIFISTHNLAEAEELCARIAVVKTKLLAIDTPERLRDSLFRRLVIIKLEGSVDAISGKVAALPFVASVEVAGNDVRAELKDPERNRPELVAAIVAAGGRVMEVGEERHSLEEIYMNLVQGDKA